MIERVQSTSTPAGSDARHLARNPQHRRAFPVLGTGTPATFAESVFLLPAEPRTQLLFNTAHEEYLQILNEGA